MRVLIKGPPGVGKTHFICWLGLSPNRADNKGAAIPVLDSYSKRDRSEVLSRTDVIAVTCDMSIDESDFDLVLVAKLPEGK